MTCAEAAELYSVSESSAIKWARRKRETGSAAALRQGGRKPRKLEDHRDWLLARLDEKADLTLAALREELHQQQGAKVCIDTLWRFLKACGKSFKKTLRAAEQDRPDIARRRYWWRKYQPRIEPTRLSFIDETWIKTNMTRLRGWCQKGLPLISSLAHGHWKTLTLIAALRVDGLTAPFVLDGPVNRMAFAAYVEHVLLPTLSPRDVVVMDNLNSHKGGEV
jgi:transposase